MIHNILATIDLDFVVQVAKHAGEGIMSVYDSQNYPEVFLKEDLSPVSTADLIANSFITKQLLSQYPDVPVISEESEKTPFEIRCGWQSFWLVDPLDGTREFLDKNGEFTINIALIVDCKPVLGVVHAPALQQTYYGSLLHGAYKQIANFQPRQIATRSHNKNIVAVHSKSHSLPQEEKVLKALGAKERIQIGSSLKFCLVADGTANLYYRHGPTMEWDTAAGQVIVEAAGGSVTTPSRKPLVYNKESLRNGSFLCIG